MVSSLAPQASASANSATPARGKSYGQRLYRKGATGDVKSRAGGCVAGGRGRSEAWGGRGLQRPGRYPILKGDRGSAGRSVRRAGRSREGGHGSSRSGRDGGAGADAPAIRGGGRGPGVPGDRARAGAQ